jgi:hypothetical protein
VSAALLSGIIVPEAGACWFLLSRGSVDSGNALGQHTLHVRRGTRPPIHSTWMSAVSVRGGRSVGNDRCWWWEHSGVFSSGVLTVHARGVPLSTHTGCSHWQKGVVDFGALLR